MFLQTCFVTITTSLLYYPVFRLNKTGRVNLMILKWAFGVLSMAVFLHMIRNRKFCLSEIFYSLYKITWINQQQQKWFSFVLCFFFLLFQDTKIFSSLVLATLAGLKMFRELPFLFPKTFTFNELVILMSIASSWCFAFIFHIFQVSMKFKKENWFIGKFNEFWITDFNQPLDPMIEEIFVVEVSFHDLTSLNAINRVINY